MKPSIGRIVHYTLNDTDAHLINQRRGETGAQGNVAHAGDAYPAVVVRVFDPSVTTANLQVLLDGTDTYWATSRQEGETPGTWCWPPREGMFVPAASMPTPGTATVPANLIVTTGTATVS